MRKVCNSIFGPRDCEYWSFRKSDKFGLFKTRELALRHLSSDQINSILLQASAGKALHHPFQYTLLTFVEGLKMFFWESTQVGFVGYPDWLQKIYDTRLFNNALRFLVSIASFWAVLRLWGRLIRSPVPSIEFSIGVLVFLYILFFSFFFILTRYGLPIAPLYLIAIGIWLDQNLSLKK